MKIVAISDTHSTQGKFKLPEEGDVIIHAGDATGRGSEFETRAFVKWYGGLNYKYKVFTPGNHDFYFEEFPTEVRKLCKDHGIILLIDEEVIIEGIKIYGSPQSPWFYDWAFNKARNEAERARYGIELIKHYWDMIPEDTDILVTHGPPYEILDELVTACGNPKGIFVGCQDLLKRIAEVRPDLHIFGHIHCGHGERHIEGVSYYNASICDEMYYPSYSPIVIDYTKEGGSPDEAA